MKNLYKIILTTLGVAFYLSQTVSTANAAACNWKSRNAYPYFWDSCGSKYSLNAYVVYKSSSSCFKYQWTVNGNKAGNGYTMNYPITANGTYNVCVKVTDTCNSCDTTYCSSRTITCVKSTCNWKSRIPYFSVTDSCAGKVYKYSVNGYVAFNYSKAGCFKYQWTVNSANAGTSRSLYYKITANGTYTVCMKVTDTCNNCDTTFCSTRTFTCVSGSSCNWNARSAATGFWDSCTGKKYKYSLNGYISLKTGSCYTYLWSVNGSKAGTGYIFSYPITANGTYKVCVQVYDSCNKCDTTYCTTRTITCVSSSTCNWKSRSPNYYYWDSCNTTKNTYSLNGYLAFSSKTCLKYQWTVNGNNAGNGYVFNYPIKQNGSYAICVKVTDTCYRCDTTYCTTRNITCVKGSTCNWKSRNPYFSVGDSCDKKYNVVYLAGYTYFNYSKSTCFKYQWTVNGSPVSSSSSNPRMLNYTVTKNGSYVVCMKVTDTCNNCDTTFCSTKNITCIASSKCNWKSKAAATGYWDSCNATKNRYSLNAYISFSSKTCLKYQWTVNGNNAGNGYIMNYPIKQNGSYSVCVKVTDTCNNCDTTYCTTRGITCVKSNTCNWKSRSANTYFKDSCNTSKSYLIAYISFSSKSCLKYQWTVNGTSVGNSYYINYPITQNGTYSLCVKVTDTCNNCDTTYCSTKTISCMSSSKCNWKARTPALGYWDSCTGKRNKYSLNGYALFTNYFYKSCLKYQWTVNGNYAGNSDWMSYPITANGTYSVCVKVMDTCNKCDTTYCTTRTITCVGSSKCNWKSRSPNYYFWDSCGSKRSSLNAYIAFSSKSCLKYQWMVNGNKAGNGYIMNYPVSANGKYDVCVTVTDTCNKCDTTYCSSRNITCMGAKCNWKAQGPYVAYWDSCTGKRNKYSLNAYISFSGGRKCHVYQWTVNGKSAGSGYVLNYPVSGNGTYSVCLKVTDTCNNCDTTFCTYRVFNCGSTKCNWKSKNAYFLTKDTCITSIKNYSVNGVLYLGGTSSCFTYQWTVNSNNAGTNQYMNYTVTQNGTYSICVKVKDTCNKCDTTYCSYVKVSCVPAGIHKMNNNQILKVYPNPTEGMVNVDWAEGTSTYLITGSTGQIVQTGTIENGVNTLDLNKYSTGLYLIQVRTGNAILTEKISVQKR